MNMLAKEDSSSKVSCIDIVISDIRVFHQEYCVALRIISVLGFPLTAHYVKREYLLLESSFWRFFVVYLTCIEIKLIRNTLKIAFYTIFCSGQTLTIHT